MSPVASAAVVPSSNPSRDARFLVNLAGPRFIRLNDEESAEQTTAVIASGDDSLPPTNVLFVDFGSHQKQREVPPFAAPNSTLIVPADLISHVTKTINSEEDGINTIKCSVDDDYCWVVMQLSGGSTLLLASSVKAVYRYANDVNDVVGNKNKTNGVSDAAVDAGTEPAAVEEPPYKFPSLAMSVLSNKEVLPGFQINTRVGVPIESDLFVGQVLLIMRPPDPNDDPYYNEKVFSKKKRRFEIQIQGKFKYVPTGTIWCGMEITQEMKLGLVAKGLCNLLLRLVSKTGPGDMHFSFGDKNNEEMAHISFPAWTAFDKVVVTKPGDEPPPLGEVLPESDKAASARKKLGTAGDWNTQDTYSFSYHSMYLDLPIWHVVNLPTADMDLKTFWRDALLRIVVYENGSMSKGKHLQSENKYIAGIQAEYLGFDDENINDMLEEKDSLPLDQQKLSYISRSISFANLDIENDNSSAILSTPSSIGGWDMNTIESDGEETLFYDATDKPRSESENDALDGLEGNLEGSQVFVEMPINCPVEMGSASNVTPNNLLLYDMLCPGWVDICSEQRGKYTKAFAFASLSARGVNQKVIFRTEREFSQLFALTEAKLWAEENCSPRLSNSEKHRRIMGYTLAAFRHNTSTQSEQRCQALWNQPDCRFSDIFLKRAPPSDTKVKSDDILFSGYVGRAFSERHWIEEWVIVTDRLVSFYHPDKKRPSYRIRLKGVLGVKDQDLSDCPHFPSYHFLVVETVSRETYIMFHSQEGCRKMHRALQNKLGSQEGASPNGGISPLTFDDPSEEYLHKSSLYKCDQRRVLNNRKFAFNSLGKIGFDDRMELGIHPLALVQNVLRKVLVPNLMDETDKASLNNFLNAASELKSANLAGLSETEKSAFYINLYHVMVMHGFLVFGVPLSVFDFVNHFGKVAYEVDDDIMSLKELEHNIIRANMTSPSKFVGRFVLPKQVYKHVLRNGDFRMNFAINCGSLSNPSAIQVYTAEDLDSQLDEAAREYLKVATVSPSGRCLTLPKMCQWYANDFGEGSLRDVVRLVVKYLSAKDNRLLRPSFSDVRVRHLGYEYKCRHLRLTDV